MLYKRYGSADFWTTKGVQLATGVGMFYGAAKTVIKIGGIQYNVDPTSANVPGTSPNLERALFTSIENFRFADGKAIDFRGVPERAVNGIGGTLADSNQRQSKGFTPTFAVDLTLGKVRIAKFKLDWLFVKSDLEQARDTKGSYLFAPAFPRTLVDLNNCPPTPLSDHSPMIVDLPFRDASVNVSTEKTSD